MPSYDVFSYGTIGMDIVLRVPHWPSPDDSTHAPTPDEHLGGKATNAAAHLAKWGLQVGLSGTILGGDEIGQRVLAMLNRIRSIHTDYLEVRNDMASMYCLIMVNPRGERAIIGVNSDGHPYSEPRREMVASARILTLDLYGGVERITAARMASEAKILVVVGDLRRIDHPILPYTTAAIASAAELRREYPGMSLPDFGRQVLQRGVSRMIVTDGPYPVLAMDTNDQQLTVAAPDTRVADTTGAGDAFRAGVVYGMIQGMDLADTVRHGIAAGSLAVGQAGAASTPPDLGDVQALARTLG